MCYHHCTQWHTGICFSCLTVLCVCHLEGIDDLLNWEMAKSQYVPRNVLNQMESPHLVVVRAAHEEMSLGDVMDIIRCQDESKRTNQLRQHEARNATSSSPLHGQGCLAECADDVEWSSARAQGSCQSETKDNSVHTYKEGSPWSTNVYVEYMPLRDSSLVGLFMDMTSIVADKSGHVHGKGQGREGGGHGSDIAAVELLGRHAEWVKYLVDGNGYLWLGDGNTVGKVHFDPFDNLLMQVRN